MSAQFCPLRYASFFAGTSTIVPFHNQLRLPYAIVLRHLLLFGSPPLFLLYWVRITVWFRTFCLPSSSFCIGSVLSRPLPLLSFPPISADPSLLLLQ